MDRMVWKPREPKLLKKNEQITRHRHRSQLTADEAGRILPELQWRWGTIKFTPVGLGASEFNEAEVECGKCSVVRTVEPLIRQNLESGGRIP